MDNTSILVITDEPWIADLLKSMPAWNTAGISLTTATDIGNVVSLAADSNADCILTGRPPDEVEAAALFGGGAQVVCIVQDYKEEEAEKALGMGAYDYLSRELVLAEPGLLFRSIMHAAGFGKTEKARLSAEKALMEEEKNHQVIMDSIGESIIIQDTDYKVLYQNKASIEFTGDHVGEFCYAAFEREPDICPVCPVRDSFEDGNIHREVKELAPEKGGLAVELTGSSLTDSDGNIIAGVKVVRDISERKRLECQRKDMIAMFTHDLKSPLSTIYGYAEIITQDKKDVLDEETMDMVESIMRSSTKLLSLVNGFLDIERMESGDAVLTRSPVDMAQLVGELSADFMTAIRNKGLTLETAVGKDIPKAMLDRKHVERAVANLLQNAVNFTPEGGRIDLKAAAVADGGRDCVMISVTDTGPGIPPDEQVRVFEKNYRSARTAGVSGSGLGLAIVKAVAEAHGGRVELESEEGKGSSFRLYLPVGYGRVDISSIN